GRCPAGARRGHRRGRPRRTSGPFMIRQPMFSVEPWCLRETMLNLDMLAQSESVFALSNGHLGWRGNLDEGEPHALPGTYLNGFYEVRPLPYAEASYGLPESGQTVINVTNGKLIRLFVDDEPFDVRYGGLRVGTAMDHRVEGPKVHVESQAFEDGGVVTATAVVKPGQRLRLTKFVAYGWSGARSLPAVRDQVWAALTTARQTGWDGLLAEQREYLDEFWHRADVEI